jgi:hypothetical protein
MTTSGFMFQPQAVEIGVVWTVGLDFRALDQVRKSSVAGG